MTDDPKNDGAESQNDRADSRTAEPGASTTHETVFSARTRRVGATLLLLTGALGALLGVVLLYYFVTGGFAGVPPVTIALFAVPILLVAVLQLVGGWLAWRGRRWRVAIGAGVVGLLFSPNPVLVPVKVVALVFLGLSEDQFA